MTRRRTARDPQAICRSPGVPELPHGTSVEGASRLRALVRRWLPAVIWTGVVLGFSSDALAAAQTSRVLLPLLRIVFPSADPETLEALHLGLRKLAHAVEYAILAALYARAVSGRFRLEGGAREVLLHQGGRILLGVALVAAVDEYRQSLSPVRTGSIRDWGIDLCGASLALMLLWRARAPARGASGDVGKQAGSW
ncbi:hypothetical protein HRbin10_01095 [bacterium HR10]|nr:hypothetical protein HRbin10_01095 [bacterium HR10]